MAKTATNKTTNNLIVRAASVLSDGLNIEERSIGCVLSTESPVRMYDWRNGEYVDEILRADGAEFSSQLPLLDNHSRYQSSDVVGSARDIKVENNQIVGRVYFAEDIERVDDIWKLVKQRHLTDVSIGYRYTEKDYVDVKRGQTATIKGRTYKATDSTLRVVTRWGAKELSVTPIGADDLAKMRSLSDCKFGHGNFELQSSENIEQNDESKNIRKDQEMPKTQSTEADNKERSGEENVSPAPSQQGAASTESNRGESSVQLGQSNQVDPKKETTATIPDGTRAERERIQYAHTFANQGIRGELIQQAINDGWTRERMHEQFLHAITGNRQQPTGTGIAIHSHDNELTRESIQSLFLQRAGVEIEGGHLTSKYHRATFDCYDGHEQNMSFAIRTAEKLERKGTLERKEEQALEFAYRHRNVTLVQALSMALDFANVRYSRFDSNEIIKRAVMTQSVAAFVTNALGARILDAFAGVPDTTDWCAEVMLPNDNPQPVAKGGMISRLRKRVSGQVPVPAVRDATEEYISVATFSEQYYVDRKDFLADRWGRIGEGPDDLGIAAKEVIIDLVYAVLLSNPVMADGNTLFSAAHGNVGLSAPLGPASLAARKTAMANQKNNERLIGARPGVLLVPESNSHYAEELLGSSEKRDTTANTVYGTKNWAQNKYRVVSEPRLDVGVVNPNDDTFVAGKPTDFYLIDLLKRFGLLKAFLQSNAGGPIVVPWTPGDGRIGFGTTVELEAGVKAVAWEGLQRGTGAGS